MSATYTNDINRVAWDSVRVPTVHDCCADLPNATKFRNLVRGASEVSLYYEVHKPVHEVQWLWYDASHDSSRVDSLVRR